MQNSLIRCLCQSCSGVFKPRRRAMKDEGLENSIGKRPLVSKGNTSCKPNQKHRKNAKKNTKRVSFPRRSPSKVSSVLDIILVQLVKKLKTRKSWSATEDAALVQFVK